jgi:hypothetical protein
MPNPGGWGLGALQSRKEGCNECAARWCFSSLREGGTGERPVPGCVGCHSLVVEGNSVKLVYGVSSLGAVLQSMCGNRSFDCLTAEMGRSYSQPDA